MGRHNRFLVLVLALLLPASVVAGYRATFDSFKDPETKPFSADARILVLCKNNDDFSYRKLVEDSVADSLQTQLSIAAIPSIAVFLPTREYTDEERAQIIKEKGITAVLTVIYTGGDTHTVQSTVATPIGSGMTVATTRERYRGMTHEFSLELIDSSTARKLWISQAVARCGRYGDRDTVVRNLAASLAEEWKAQALAGVRSKPH